MDNPTPPSHSPNNNHVNSIVSRALNNLKKGYSLVDKTQIHVFHAWLVIGMAIGIASTFIFVANRSGEFQRGQAQTVTCSSNSNFDPDTYGTSCTLGTCWIFGVCHFDFADSSVHGFPNWWGQCPIEDPVQLPGSYCGYNYFQQSYSLYSESDYYTYIQSFYHLQTDYYSESDYYTQSFYYTQPLYYTYTEASYYWYTQSSYTK